MSWMQPYVARMPGQAFLIKTWCSSGVQYVRCLPHTVTEVPRSLRQSSRQGAWCRPNSVDICFWLCPPSLCLAKMVDCVAHKSAIRILDTNLLPFTWFFLAGFYNRALLFPAFLGLIYFAIQYVWPLFLCHQPHSMFPCFQIDIPWPCVSRPQNNIITLVMCSDRHKIRHSRYDILTHTTSSTLFHRIIELHEPCFTYTMLSLRHHNEHVVDFDNGRMAETGQRVDVNGIWVLGFSMAIWGTVFLEYWKRKEAKLRMVWGMTHFSEKVRARVWIERTYHVLKSVSCVKECVFLDEYNAHSLSSMLVH